MPTTKRGGNDVGGQLLSMLGSNQDCECTCSDPESGDGFVVTVKTDKLFGAVFLSIPYRQLQSAARNGNRVFVGSNGYSVTGSFRKDFLKAVRTSRSDADHSIEVRMVTVQSRSGVVCFIGNEDSELSARVSEYLPPTVEVDANSLTDQRRDRGRKVGHAAKDMALLRNAKLSPELLNELERVGEDAAWEAVEKENVVRRESLQDLRDRGVSPTIACLMVHCRRILKKRPERNAESRRLFVSTITEIFDQLPECSSLGEARDMLQSICSNCGSKCSEILGARFVNFVGRMGLFWRDDMVELLRRLEHEVPNEHSWQMAGDALSVSSVRRNSEEKRVPTRIARMLASLRRVGPQTEHGNVEALIADFGFTGVELGKWIRNSETALLLQSVSESCFDLCRLLGSWVRPMIRQGNLALALGARGKGRGCAHYEPSLRVINLTKTRGDGSFAHEFSHFLDHMLASPSSQGDSRFLSDRVSAKITDTNPIANAMRTLMGAIGTAPTMNVIQGIADPDRWFGEAWVLKAWKTEKQNAQATFDRLARQYPNKLQTGRSSATSCQTLANSLVKWTGEPIVVKAFHKKESAFLKEARRLGAYWSRPHELFARAFEFWCEDELTGRSELNEYLVDGTRNDYSKCRGLPYATGEQRLEINQGMKQLLAACAELADA